METLKKLCLSIALFYFSANIIQAQSKNDSIQQAKKQKFLTQKFWQQYNYHSKGWQIYLDSAIVFEPKNAYLWQQKSMSLFKSGEYYNGMAYLDKAVEYDTISYLGYRGFMKCVFLKDYSHAINDFKSIQKKRPTDQIMDHSYPFWIGLSYLKLNILDSAEKYLDKSINAMISKNGKDWVHFNERFYKGICSYKQKKIQNALQEFDETLRLNSNFSDAQYYKALVLLELHKKEGCLDLLQKAKENNEKGFTINEDNESYVDYPFQIKLKEINDLIESVRK